MPLWATRTVKSVVFLVLPSQSARPEAAVASYC